MTNQPVTIGTVGTSFEVIEGLDELGTAGVTELARHLGRSKSAVYKHLASLRELGYVRQTADGRYELGLQFYTLGYRTRRNEPLYRIAQDDVDELARTTGETISLVVEEHGTAVCIYQAGGVDTATPAIEESERTPIETIAAGKAILAYRSDEECVELLDREGQDGEAEYRALEAELRSIRGRKVIIERSETESNYNAVAVPVRDETGYGVGSVMLSGPAEALSGKRLEEDLPGLIISTGKSIEVALVARDDA